MYYDEHESKVSFVEPHNSRLAHGGDQASLSDQHLGITTASRNSPWMAVADVVLHAEMPSDSYELHPLLWLQRGSSSLMVVVLRLRCACGV